MNEDKLEKAIDLMISTKQLHKTLIESKVKTIGLYRTQHRMLMHLACCSKLQSQKELAEHMHITPAAVTGALKKLESDGYISKTLGRDNRFNEIEITEKGRAVVEKSHELFSATDRLLFTGFSDEELDMYITCLEKLKANMKLYQYNNTEDEK